MKPELQIKLIHKPHPYPEAPEAPLEAWGEVSIDIIRGDETIHIFSTQWDLAELAEWFVENQKAIYGEQLVMGEERPLPSESIVQALIRFYDKEFVDSDEEELNWGEALDGFLYRHSLWYGLPGSKMPNIILACHNNTGEISSRDETTTYEFDMEKFIVFFRDEINQFILTWKNSSIDPKVHLRADNILAKLNLPLDNTCVEDEFS
jgi:hypothetical protein